MSLCNLLLVAQWTENVSFINNYARGSIHDQNEQETSLNHNEEQLVYQVYMEQLWDKGYIHSFPNKELKSLNGW